MTIPFYKIRNRKRLRKETAPPAQEEPVFTLQFKVADTKRRLIELKNYLNERGYNYE